MHQGFTVLLIDDDDEFRKTLGASLRSLKADLVEAATCREALRIYRDVRPKVVFVDISMPDMNGLEFTKIITAEDASAVVAVVTGGRGEQLVVDAIRAGASEFLRKPISLGDLKASASRLAVLSERKRQKVFEAGSIIRASAHLELSTRASSVGPAVKQIMSFLRGFVDRDKLAHYELAIHEAMWNAYEHGNLAIQGEEKSDLCEQSLLEEALREREAEAVKNGVTITVAVEVDEQRFSCSIEDQGAGFDWQKAMGKKIGEESITSLHGRGLMLIQSVFDSVAYNEKGNKLTMVKYFDQA